MPLNSWRSSVSSVRFVVVNEALHRKSNSTSLEHNYNYIQSRAKMVAENVFEWLTGRWRCWLKQMDAHMQCPAALSSALSQVMVNISVNSSSPHLRLRPA